MSFPTSRAPEIWSRFYQQLDAIDDLERRLEERVKRYRRRIASSLEQAPNFRRTHMRLFVSHHCDLESSSSPASGGTWFLVVEGKFLIGLLDHASAQQVDKDGPLPTGRPARRRRLDASQVLPNPTSADADAAASRDRSKYRSVADAEEDSVEPILFSHAFSKMDVSFQTHWCPSTPTATPSLGSSQKKNRKRKSETQPRPATVDLDSLQSSSVTSLSWTKDASSTSDSHAFSVQYNAPVAPPSMTVHAVSCSVKLFPTRYETMYKPSLAFAQAFFPKHIPPPGHGESPQGPQPAPGTRLSLEGDIYTPNLLTMNEVLLALYHYISDKKLQDEADNSFLHCDKTLAEVLGCDSLNFGDIQRVLLERSMITPVEADTEPIVLHYVMNESNATPQELNPTPPVNDDETPQNHPQVLSVDVDMHMPCFFGWRAREIMRRIKRREFEYTSSRTKARYMLVASRGNEDLVKTKIGVAVSGQGYTEENSAVFAALAKAAPAGSEARGAAQADAKTCLLTSRLDEWSRRSQDAWDVANSCWVLATTSATVHESKDD
eukprot:Nitzschia sp. Nitz4//scaffold75_size92586//34561//36207//NITZ4_004850-RA/size92586-processed-gene-0.6-mRNA-1//1//CDS//3329557690//6930//frame0